jgi:hypothetical protein
MAFAIISTVISDKLNHFLNKLLKAVKREKKLC